VFLLIFWVLAMKCWLEALVCHAPPALDKIEYFSGENNLAI
jgi:hypothetical protein